MLEGSDYVKGIGHTREEKSQYDSFLGRVAAFTW